MSTLKNVTLQSITTLEQMKEFVTDLKATRTLLGGRKFVKSGMRSPVSLSAITKRFIELSNKESGDDSTKNNITDQIIKLDATTSKGSMLTRIFSNAFYNRHTELLKTQTGDRRDFLKIGLRHLSKFLNSGGMGVLYNILEKGFQDPQKHFFHIRNFCTEPSNTNKDRPDGPQREKALLKMADALFKSEQLSLQEIAISLVIETAQIYGGDGANITDQTHQEEYAKIISQDLLTEATKKART